MNLGDFIDTIQRSDCEAGGGVLPASLQALGERRGAAPPAPHPPGGAGRRHQGRGPLPEGPPWHDGRGRNGHRKDVYRRGCCAHGGLQEDSGDLPAPPGPQVEAGGRSRRSPGVRAAVVESITDLERAQVLDRLRPPVCGDEQGEGKAVLPLDARRHIPVGDLQGQAGAGEGIGRTLPRPLLPHLHGAGGGQGRGAPDR